MLNPFGRYCRKLRIDNGELLKDMATKLEVSPAFLSAVETGKKNAPDRWSDILVKLYGLPDAEREVIKRAIEESQNQVKLELKNSSDKARKVALSFAREFNELPDEKLEEIKKILQRKTGLVM